MESIDPITILDEVIRYFSLYEGSRKAPSERRNYLY